MPRFNMTGPMGRGPFTGKGMGYCAQRIYGPYGFGGPGIRGGRRGTGLGRGMGLRRGPGFGPDYYDQYLPEREYLEDEKAYLEEQLKAVNETLGKMDKDQEDRL